jgi:magnesium transporter
VSRRHRHKPSRRDLRIRRRTQPGASPGQVLPDPSHPQPTIQVLAHGPDGIVEREVPTIDAAHAMMGQQDLVWINVEGLGDAATIERAGALFGLHRLALEDTVNVHQRAKVEDYGEILFIVLRLVSCGERCATEQLSMYVGPKWVLTFQEGTPGDPFNRIRERLREGGRICQLGTGYLAYALMDAAIDAYYPVLEVYADRLDELEDSVLEPRHKHVMDRLHEVKADLLILRRAIWPLRDALSLLAREETTRFSLEVRPYLRDCYDHVVQVVELLETYRELTADLRDLHMSSVSNRINETMRILTIISTIFIPLTFIAGIYGMNFDFADGAKPLNMPELHWYWGYPLCLAAMAVTAICLVVYFYRQGWIGSGRKPG